MRRTGQEEFHARYMHDPHSATHRTLTGETNPQAHWRFGWTRSQCVTVTQLRTGHSPLLASYLHSIRRQHSPVCPHCGGDDEMAQHLLLCCPSHTQARSSTNYINSTDPRRTWSFLESIGALTRPPPSTGNERERLVTEEQKDVSVEMWNCAEKAAVHDTTDWHTWHTGMKMRLLCSDAKLVKIALVLHWSKWSCGLDNVCGCSCCFGKEWLST